MKELKFKDKERAVVGNIKVTCSMDKRTLPPVEKRIAKEIHPNNKAKSTLELIEAINVNIVDINIFLSMQVVQTTPFQILLERPFFAITKCETKDYTSKDQHITLIDSKNRRRQCKVAIKVRKIKRDERWDF